MQIVINVPEKAFKNDIEDKFQDFFKRLYEETKEHINNDTDILCGIYELETIEMFLDAFKNATPLPKRHGRKFEEIVVEYPPAKLCTYPEYRDKPYFSIKYKENEKHIIGFGTYKPEVLSEYLREYFIAPTIIEADVPKRRKGTPKEDYEPLYDCENWIP